MNQYLVVLKKEFVRDTQIAPHKDADPMGDNWTDASEDLVLGIHYAPDKEIAMRFAKALRHGLTTDMMDAYKLAD